MTGRLKYAWGITNGIEIEVRDGIITKNIILRQADKIASFKQENGCCEKNCSRWLAKKRLSFPRYFGDQYFQFFVGRIGLRWATGFCSVLRNSTGVTPWCRLNSLEKAAALPAPS